MRWSRATSKVQLKQRPYQRWLNSVLGEQHIYTGQCQLLACRTIHWLLFLVSLSFWGHYCLQHNIIMFVYRNLISRVHTQTLVCARVCVIRFINITTHSWMWGLLLLTFIRIVEFHIYPTKRHLGTRFVPSWTSNFVSLGWMHIDYITHVDATSNSSYCSKPFNSTWATDCIWTNVHFSGANDLAGCRYYSFDKIIDFFSNVDYRSLRTLDSGSL